MCERCGDTGYVEIELLAGPGEYRDPSGIGEVRCPECSDLLQEYPSEMHDALLNVQPGYAEEMRSQMDAIVQGQIEADENQAWDEYNGKEGEQWREHNLWP